MTPVQRDCARVIALVLAASAVIDWFAVPFVERGRQAAVVHGCHSPRCVQWRWWFE